MTDTASNTYLVEITVEAKRFITVAAQDHYKALDQVGVHPAAAALARELREDGWDTSIKSRCVGNALPQDHITYKCAATVDAQDND